MDRFDKTALPDKVYLSGSDCFHLVLDKHAKKHNAGNNVMRIVFYFDKKISGQKIEDILKRSPLLYWLCNIRLISGSLLKGPCWKYEDLGREVSISEHVHAVENEIPQQVLNRNIAVDAKRFVECDIIQYPSARSVLIFSWNHILMDGRGISMFINHLNEINNGQGYKSETFFPAKQKKASVLSYIKNMYEVKHFIQTSSRSPIASVACKNAKSATWFNNRVIYFTKEETAQIDLGAFNNGARFGANLFYLSCCAHIVNKVNRQRNTGGVIWLPIPYDGRLKGSFGPIISNAVAYLFYRIPVEALSDVKQTVAAFNQQMAQQLKIEMPRKYNMLLNMMRHIPLRLYYFLINRTGEGSFASFLYSSTGNNFNNIDTLFDIPVRSLTIFPSTTFPPGLTFSFLKHADALNINIAYSSDIISNIELDFIEKGLRDLLLPNN